VALVDCGVDRGSRPGIRIGNGDAAKTLSADDVGGPGFSGLGIVVGAEECGVAVGPAIDGDPRDVPGGIEATLGEQALTGRSCLDQTTVDLDSIVVDENRGFVLHSRASEVTDA